MDNDTTTRERTDPTAAGDRKAGASSGTQDLKQFVSRQLHHAAEKLSEQADTTDALPPVAQYGRQAAEWLDQSAEIVQRFDGRQVNVRIRAFVAENPGRSLLIAGAAGLIIGILMHRR